MNSLRLRAAFDATAQQQADELARAVYDGERARAVRVQKAFGARKRRLRRDEEVGRYGAHHVADLRPMPTFARQRLEVSEREYAVKTPRVSDGDGLLLMKRENVVNEVCDR